MHKGGRQGSSGWNIKPRQPIMLRSAKLKFQPRWLKTKWSRLCIVKEIRIDETIELENPNSRRTKVVTIKLLQRGHPP